VARRVPEARLVVVGEGAQAALVEQLAAETRTERRPRLGRAEVAAALDEASMLVLPSASEGLGRVIVEAFCRGRGVVGSRAGAIPGLVEDEVSGLLVPPGDAAALAEALVRVLDDVDLAARLAAGAREAAPRWALTAADHVEQTRRLVERVTA
ncbi:MAG TPA: glycosyltransferase family 4 protein, partial [Gaiellaceae bacterium]